MGYTIIFMSILALCTCTIESKKSSSKKSSTVSSTVTIYNKTTQPVFVFPIPASAPPYVLARIPQQQEGVITAPAKIVWPGGARAMIIVKEVQKDNFDQALQEAIVKFNASKNKSQFAWEQSISISLTQKGVSPHAWIVFYPEFSQMGSDSILPSAQEYSLTLYNVMLNEVPAHRMYGVVEVIKF